MINAALCGATLTEGGGEGGGVDGVDGGVEVQGGFFKQ